MKTNISLIMRNLLFTLFTFMTAITFAQSKGTVSGIVQDKDMGLEPLPFVSIYDEKDSSVGTTTDFDGLYTIKLSAGVHTLVFDFVGYETIKKQVTVKAGATQKINIVMASAADALDAVILTAVVNKESEEALVEVQKEAAIVIESVGAQQLSNQGVSDAAAATTKVTGVSKQQGSSKVYVRGLGDRYNNTTLNGLPLPSNNPSLKNISLDLFSTDMLQNVGISKTFSSLFSADLSGANINIETKQAVAKPSFAIGISTGGNSQTSFKDFKTIDGANYLGVASETEHPMTNLTTYKFEDNFSPNSRTALPNVGISLNGGREFEFDNGSSFSFFLVGSFGNSSRFVEGFNTNNLTETTKRSDFYSAKEYSYSTNKLGMGNFKYEINSSHSIYLNSLYIHSNSQKIQDYFGSNPDVDNLNVVLQTQNQNRLFVNQLISKNEIGENVVLDLSLAYNNVKNDEPNRKKNVFILDPENGDRFATGTARNNSRYYHNLNEDDYVAQLTSKIYLGNIEDSKGYFDLGYQYRNTSRDFDAIYFDHDQISSIQTVDVNDVSSFLNQDGIDARDFRLTTGFGFNESIALNPFTYGGDKIMNSANAGFNYNFFEHLNVNLGARFEDIKMDVYWETNLSGGLQSTELNKTYVLPSLNMKYALNDAHQLRFSTSKTYTYPQFKEVAEFVYEGVNYQEIGNEGLRPSDNYNLDFKYEYFPENGGLISATIFGKLIENSINRVELNSAADNFYSYNNTGDATVYGVEAEFKKDIVNFETSEDGDVNKIKFGANVTYMITDQEFETTDQFKPTNNSSQLEGAAPLIVNADLAYTLKKDDKETVGTIVFNYQDDKLYSIGNNFGGDVGLGNIMQKYIYTLDVVFKHKFNESLTLKASAKNLLNSDIERYRDLGEAEITNVSYKRGVDFGLSIGYDF